MVSINTPSLSTQKPKRGGWLRVFTLGFLAASLFAVFLFSLMGRTAFWSVDGYQQYYPALVYFGQWIRHVLQFGTVPMIDFCIGEGMDILSSFAYYGFGDPLNLLFAFSGERGAEVLFTVLVFVRLYLSGVTFGLFASRYVSSNTTVAIGCMVYVFTGNGLYFAAQAPIFIYGMVFLPLVLLLLEETFLGSRKCYPLLAACVGLMFLCNFYEGIQVTIFAFLYALARILILRKEPFCLASFRHWLAIAGTYLLGVFLSAVLVFPIAYALLSCGRVGGGTGYNDSMLVFPLSYYLRVLREMFMPIDTSFYWRYAYRCQLGFLPVALPCLVLMLSQKTEKQTRARLLKIGFFSCLLFVCVPVFGKLFNAGGYVTHRWIFAFGFIMALIAAKEAANLKNAQAWQKILAVSVLILEVVLWIIENGFGFRVILLLLIVIPLILYLLFGKRKEKPLFAISCLHALLFIMVSYLSSAYLDEFLESGLMEKIDSEPFLAVEDIDTGDAFYRIAESEFSESYLSRNNHGAIRQKMLNTYYMSIVPVVCKTFNEELGLSNAYTSLMSCGYSSRTPLLALSSVKYFAQSKSDDAIQNIIPYGFRAVYENEYAIVYENEFALPAAYFYENTMSEDAFYSLDLVDRQNALLLYAVTENGNADAVIESAKEVPYTVTKQAAQETFHYVCSFHAEPGYEYYATLDKCSPGEDNLFFAFDIIHTEENQTYRSIVSAYGEKQHMGAGSHSGVINLGHADSGKADGGEIRFVYYEKALPYIDNLRIFAVPITEYENAVRERKESAIVSDIQYSRVGTESEQNFIECTVKTEKSGVLQFAVPFLDGYTAYVDGAEVPLYRSGIKYCGVMVDAGTHTVRLEYTTPFIRLGAVVSAAAILILAVLLFVAYRETIQTNSVAKFLISGGITTGLDFVLFMLLSRVLPVPLSKLISISTAAVLSFFLNRSWTFDCGKKYGFWHTMQPIRFALAQGLNIGTNTGITWLVFSVTESRLLAFVLATGIAMIVNYILQKKWVFRKENT